MLPDSVFQLYPPLFEALPLESAMADLVTRRPNYTAAKIAGEAVCQLAVAKDPMLAAGIWLYVDDLEAAHQLVQYNTSQTASWWHATLHRREGDFGNSLYWYRQAERHPQLAGLGFEPRKLVDMAQSGDPAGIDLQRKEWAYLMGCLVSGQGS